MVVQVSGQKNEVSNIWFGENRTQIEAHRIGVRKLHFISFRQEIFEDHRHVNWCIKWFYVKFFTGPNRLWQVKNCINWLRSLFIPLQPKATRKMKESWPKEYVNILFKFCYSPTDKPFWKPDPLLGLFLG